MIGNLENLDSKNMPFINRLGIYFYSIFVQVKGSEQKMLISQFWENTDIVMKTFYCNEKGEIIN